jgi:hypothetical protein
MTAKSTVIDLNSHYSVDEYLALDHESRLGFRSSLKQRIAILKESFQVRFITREDVLAIGLKQQSKTAIALEILLEKRKLPAYDSAFHYKETIAALRAELLIEVFGGKQLFYALEEHTIGIDPNYLPFLLGKKYKL